MSHVRVGIIGGGLMGREVASAFGRWFVLQDFPATVELVAVADTNPEALAWFDRIPSVRLKVADYRDLLRDPDIDVVYVAVPHNLHEKIYADVLAAGKDLFAEKPFGIDLKAATNIAMAARVSGRFVRCSSEFPFMPGANRAFRMAASGELGDILEIHSGFWHSSDLDPSKPINWKRQNATCGEAGVMNDLGMHVLHLPLRLGWRPKRVFAQLQNIVSSRPDGKGGTAVCDTWDNAMIHADVEIAGRDVPMRLETKRIAPGEMNTWFFEVLGTEGGVRYSTKDPKTLWTFRRDNEQIWQRLDIGHVSGFPTVTGPIFEAGFPDCFLQMWAAFIAEREGFLGERLGCVKPDEALFSHQIFAAALESDRTKSVVKLG